MIKFENIETHGWEAAMRGARNPLDSWDRGDTPTFEYSTEDTLTDEVSNPYLGDSYRKDYDYNGDTASETTIYYTVGPNDLDLAMRLSKAGSDHGKFMRMIVVYMDITAPLYFFKELDTYKVGTVANSCSTMHKIHDKELTIDDFSYDHLNDDSLYLLKKTIGHLNSSREHYLTTNNKEYWWQMIQLLPSSYNQKRTVMLNYEVLKNIYHARKNHKLDEWRDFCWVVEGLPFSELITLKEAKNDR